MISLAWVAPVVAAQRLSELWLCRRNRLRLLSRGGREVRPDTYKVMVSLHVLFLASLSLESYPWRVPEDIRTWTCLAALAVVTALRYWAIASLGMYWNTRVVVVPGTRLVRAGPYRSLRHPNYLVIVLEFLLLPLLMRAPVTLVLFSLANLAVLRQRIRIEEAALEEIVRHRLLPWFLLPIGLLAGLGCAQKLPIEEGRMVIALPGAPVNVDPRVATDAYGEQILQMTHASLVSRDAAGEPLPDLAQRWESPDPLTYRFHLRPGLRFHDGRPLTSADVRYTFAWILDAANRSPHRGLYRHVAAIGTPDARTVVFRLSEPFAPFLSTMVRGIVPAESPARGYAPPVGAGPYRIDDLSPDGEAVLSAFDGYYGGSPPIRSVTVKFVPDSNVRFLELKMGSVNFTLNGVDPDLLPAASLSGRLVVEEGPGGNVTYLGFHLRDRALSDARVRRAIALAIDRETIVRTIWKGRADLVSSILPPGSWAHDPDLPAAPYDPARAGRLLDDAGFPDPDGDGPLPRLRLTYKTSQNEVRRRVATVIQEQLRQVGIAVEIQSLEWGTFFSDIKKGNFQIYSLTWVGISDPDIFHHAFHSRSGPPDGANRGGYSDVEVDRLTESARLEPSREKRRAMYRRVQRILARDLPVFPMWAGRNLLVRDRRLTGFRLTPDESYAPVRAMRIVPDPVAPSTGGPR
ncbi:ABC transporter substrate-binding protein [Candidatus Deferrimicrobium sp.]|uniref:ABC transporter substrate-binding protein n=1 Tax=Candidatus Deferrimicrobium sp. TaxID=3060586 RepID=UPI002ED8FCDA